MPRPAKEEGLVIDVGVDLGGGQRYAGKVKPENLEATHAAIVTAEEKWKEYNAALDALPALGLEEVLGPSDPADPEVRPERKARKGAKAKPAKAAAKKPVAGGNPVKHKCCGSKQQRHKKGCEKGDGGLPPDEEEEKAAVAKKRDVKCIECDWQGVVGPTVDVGEMKCPTKNCGGRVVEK